MTETEKAVERVRLRLNTSHGGIERSREDDKVLLAAFDARGKEIEGLKKYHADAEGEAVSAYRRKLDEIEALKGVLHDAEATPMSEWAPMLVVAKENVAGTAALLAECEAQRNTLLKEIEALHVRFGQSERS